MRSLMDEVQIHLTVVRDGLTLFRCLIPETSKFAFKLLTQGGIFRRDFGGRIWL